MSSNQAGLIMFIGIVLAWPGSCYSYAERERRVSEAVARRAIEREFHVPADKAQELIQKQREWEGR